jgi:hypothetical protein
MHYFANPDFLQDHLTVCSCYLDSEGIEIKYTLAGEPGRMKLSPKEASKVLVDLELVRDRELTEGTAWLLVEVDTPAGSIKPVWMHWEHWATQEVIGPVWAKRIAIRHIEDEELKHALWLVYCDAQKRPELN